LFCSETTNAPIDKGELNAQMLKDGKQAVANSQSTTLKYAVRNTDRSVGALLSGEIAKHHGNHDFEDTPIKVELTGTAGQSLQVVCTCTLKVTQMTTLVKA
jgi:glutamate synthase (NADPH/NADH) large chain